MIGATGSNENATRKSRDRHHLEAVASVSAGEEDGEGFVTTVRYQVPGEKGIESGLAFEKFTGDDALSLYKYIVGQNPDA